VKLTAAGRQARVRRSGAPDPADAQWRRSGWRGAPGVAARDAREGL